VSNFEIIVFNGVLALLVTVFGIMMRQLFGRLTKHETETAERFEKARDRHDNDIKSVYSTHNKVTSSLSDKQDQLRVDINSLSESLREQMAVNAKETNALIMQVLNRRGQ